MISLYKLFLNEADDKFQQFQPQGYAYKKIGGFGYPNSATTVAVPAPAAQNADNAQQKQLSDSQKLSIIRQLRSTQNPRLQQSQ